MRTIMPTVFKRETTWLLAAVSILAPIILGACSAVKPAQPISPILPTRVPILACDSGEFALPASLLAAGKKTEGGGYQVLDKRFFEQTGWLSVRLDLAENVVRYGAPVLFQFTITNEKNHPVIFVRPRYMSFVGDSTNIDVNLSVELFVDMVSSSGERVRPRTVTMAERVFYSPPKEDFSVLPPGKSCTVALQLIWDETDLPLEEPVPPGNYRMSVILVQNDLGPRISKYENLDIGAWVGASDPSNEVILTILPPEK